MNIKEYDVIIIGSGISGLKTGIELNKNGLDTVILEGRDRLGGRLYTELVNGYPVDLGASWFHDCLTNPLFLKYQDNDHVSYYFDDGKPQWVNSQLDNLEYMDYEPVLHEFFRYVQLTHDNKKDDSLHNLVNEYILSKQQFLTDDQSKYMPQIARFIELWFGSCWDQTSLMLATEMEHDGRNAFITSGYQSVYQQELKEYPAERILCNKLVTNIELGNKIVVKCKDGSIYKSKYIVCTIPQPCLTSTDYTIPGSIKWTPNLPPKLTMFFPKMSFSALGKVAFEFEKIYWPLQNDRIWCIGDPVPHTDGDQLIKCPILPENSVLETEPTLWKYPVLFVNVAKFSGKPILILLIQAPITQYIESLDSDDKIWQYFAPFMKTLIGDPACKPIKIIKTTWTQDPLARGSYTGGKVGGDYEGGINLLITGLPRVRFAGEHTIFQGNGCAHGAWLSGKREAEYIIKKFNKL